MAAPRSEHLLERRLAVKRAAQAAHQAKLRLTDAVLFHGVLTKLLEIHIAVYDADQLFIRSDTPEYRLSVFIASLGDPLIVVPQLVIGVCGSA